VWSIVRIDNGTVTTLANGPTQPLAAGDQIAIRITGAAISALHFTAAANWTQVLTYDTSNDTTRYTNAGSLAVEFKTSTIDNFGGGTVTAITTPPANQTPPSITGTASVGQTLTLNPGAWTGTPTPTITQPWSGCVHTATNCVSNTADTTNRTPPPTTLVPAATLPRSNQTPPSITGTATAGQTLTLNTGSWTGTPTPTITQQWRDCDSAGNNCVAIPGATATTYTLTNTDVGSTITALVTATNPAGTTNATTPPTAVVAAATTPP